MRVADDLTCQRFVELVTERLEDALPAELSAAFEAHIEICDGCRVYVGQMRLTVRALRRPQSGAIPLSVREEMVRLFRVWRTGEAPKE